MKKTKFTETQIVKAIQEHEAGRKAEDICRDLILSGVFIFNRKEAKERKGFVKAGNEFVMRELS